MEMEEDGIQFQLKQLYKEKQEREEIRREQAKSQVTPSSNSFTSCEDSISGDNMPKQDFAIDYLDDQINRKKNKMIINDSDSDQYYDEDDDKVIVLLDDEE